MGGGGQKMKILALEPNWTKFCIHNLWAYRELEIQKLSTQNGGEFKKWKFLPLKQTEPNFVYIICGPIELEIKKLTTQNGGRVKK